jgi:hypothetical protein
LLIPDNVRMAQYGDNLIGGLAMSMHGPLIARLLLNAFVVGVGALILSGAVNTAIVGSNGVLSRIAEDGVIPQWFLRLHPKYGTSHRLLYTIVGLQLFTIIASRGDVVLLGEAYAFGVVWSFSFNALSMLVLRFKAADRPRGFRVPLNLRIRGVDLPIGLSLIFLVLLASAITNVLTKKTATIAGLSFTVALFVLFTTTEYIRRRRAGGVHPEHIDEFNEAADRSLTPDMLGLTRPYRKLVAIRSPYHLDMLEKTIAETDPDTTDVVVMTAHVQPLGGVETEPVMLDAPEKQLMTAVLKRAETAGKKIIPIVVSTNNPLHAILETVRAIKGQELIVGASNQFSPSEQLDQLSLYWINLHQGEPSPLTIRIIGRQRDFHIDLAGGTRIPTITERQARSVAELRAAGVGVGRVLFVHDGTQNASDLHEALLTMLDADVILDVAQAAVEPDAGRVIAEALARAKQVGRQSDLIGSTDQSDGGLLRAVVDGEYDALVARSDLATLRRQDPRKRDWIGEVLQRADCQVFLAVESTPMDSAEESEGNNDANSGGPGNG